MIDEEKYLLSKLIENLKNLNVNLNSNANKLKLMNYMKN